MLEVVVWDFKGEESTSREDGKAMFDKQRFAGQTTGQEDTEWTVISRPCSVSLTILCIFFAEISADCSDHSVPGRGPLSKFF